MYSIDTVNHAFGLIKKQGMTYRDIEYCKQILEEIKSHRFIMNCKLKSEIIKLWDEVYYQKIGSPAWKSKMKEIDSKVEILKKKEGIQQTNLFLMNEVYK